MPTYREDLHLGHKVPLVETDDIIRGAITSDKIDNGAITEDKIRDGAVTESKIADGAVSGEKIQDDSIGSDKIKDGAVEGRHIQRGAVTIDKIAEGTLDGLDAVLSSNFIAIDVEENGDIVVYLGEEGRNNDIEIDDESGDVLFVINDNIEEPLPEEPEKEVYFADASGDIEIDAAKYKMAVITCTGDVTNIRLSSMPAVGKDFDVIFYSDTKRTISIKGDILFPDSPNFQATIPENGYTEINYLYDGNKLYLRCA